MFTIKRIIALILTLVISFSCLIVPARADVSGDIASAFTQSNFAQYVVQGVCALGGRELGALIGGTAAGPLGALLGGGAGALITDLAAWYAAGHTDQEVYDAMSEYNTGLQTDLGSACITSSGKLHVTAEIVYVYGPSGTVSDSVGQHSFFVTVTLPSDVNQGVVVGGQIGPFPFKYNYVMGANCSVQNCTYNETTMRSGMQYKDCAIQDTVSCSIPASNYPLTVATFSGVIYADVVPTGGSSTLSSLTQRDITPASRCGSLQNVYYQTTEGDTYQTTIVDETNLTLQIPGSDTTINFTDWNYDYNTRSYQLTTGDGVYNVTFGDDYLTISNGSTSNNYYYVVPSGDSGGGSGGGSSGTDYTSLLETIIAKLEAVASAVTDQGTSITASIASFQTWLDARLEGITGTVNISPGSPGCEHSYTSTVDREATCTLPGVRTYKCSLCGNTYAEVIASLGHDWLCTGHVEDEIDSDTQEVVKDGYDIYTCSRCAETYNDYSGEGAPEDGGNDSISSLITRIFEKLGNFVGDIIDMLLSGLDKIFTSFDGLITKFNEKVQQISGFGGAYPAFLGGLWDVIPADLQLALGFCVLLLALAVVGKKLFFTS